MDFHTPTGEPDTLWAALEAQADLHPDKTAFRILRSNGTEQQNITFGALRERALACARQLMHRGVAGRPAVLFQPTGIDFIVHFFGVLRGGGAVIPLNPHFLVRRPEEIRAVLTDARPVILMSDQTNAARIDRIVEDRSALCLLGDETEGTSASIRDLPYPAANATAVIQYTSGSTSSPKGVCVSHANFLANARQLTAIFSATAEDVAVSWLPFFHDMGLMTGLIWPVSEGASAVLLGPSTFSARPVSWLRALSTYRGSISAAPNFAYQLCVDRVSAGDAAALDLSSWRVAICGAEPVIPETVEEFLKRFACSGLDSRAFFPSYGLAEATLFVSGGRAGGPPRILTVDADALERDGIVRQPDPDARQRKLVSCGAPASNLKVRIVDPASARVASESAVGEIWISGPSVASGYFGQSTATAETFSAAIENDDTQARHLRTGDLGFIERDEIFVVGRLKDLIIVRGVKHAPQDLETTCRLAHPSLTDERGVVFGLEGEAEGRIVVLHETRCVPGEQATTVIDAIRVALSREHGLSPDAVALLAPRTLPLTSSGKVRRGPTRAAWLAETLPTLAAWRVERTERNTTDRLLLKDSAPQTLAELLDHLERNGIIMWLEGGEVRLRGRLSGFAPEIDAIRQRKPEVVQLLAGRSAAAHAGAAALLDVGEATAFAAAGPDGFRAMLNVDRLVSRSTGFDRMILASDSHAWSPLDPRYLDFREQFDVKTQPLLREEAFVCLRAPSVSGRLSDPVDRVRFINRIAWVRFSNLLHGEQGALNLSASLCSVLRDQGAQEFAANQTREEARHVAAFSRYIKQRWGRPAPVLPALRDFLGEIILATDVTKKIVGMQVMVEGLAMGSLGSLYRHLLDPVGKRLVQLVMTDETFHHRFGKLWADQTMPRLTEIERQRLETWTSHCLHDFILKMNPPFELQVLFKEFGLDPKIVAREIQEIAEGRLADTALGAKEIFRVLTQTLLGADLLSKDARAAYLTYVATDSNAEIQSDYDDIVYDGLSFLRSVNDARFDETDATRLG